MNDKFPFLILIDIFSFFMKFNLVILSIEALLIIIILTAINTTDLLSIKKKLTIVNNSPKKVNVGGIPTFRNKIITHIIVKVLLNLSMLLLENKDRPSELSYMSPIILNIIDATKP